MNNDDTFGNIMNNNENYGNGRRKVLKIMTDNQKRTNEHDEKGCNEKRWKETMNTINKYEAWC